MLRLINPQALPPPSGAQTRRCLPCTGTFLRGVLDKVGVQPELVRIGKFKSAGD